MNKIICTIVCLAFFASFGVIKAQDIPVNPTEVVTGTYYGLSKPLRDLPPMTAEEYKAIEKRAEEKQFNESMKYKSFPFESTALPKGNDPVWQNFMGNSNVGRTTIVNFAGQNSPYFPPDDNGVAGPDHYMQTINCVYAIYDKSGNLVAGPTNLNLLFGSVPGANRNDGDPIILYDKEADRWLVTEFSIPYSGPNYMLMAVSATNDPTGTWHQYSFQVAAMPDYPKFGIWQDGYYMGDNNASGNDIYVMEREQMLVGGTAHMVGFNNPYRPGSASGFMCVPPLDNDGVFAPAGTPGMYIAFSDDGFGGGTDQLWIYELDVNWDTLSNSSFNRVQQIDVEPFNANFGPTWNNIVQPGTSQKLDAICEVIMNAPQYRNFGTYEAIVCCHSVKVTVGNQAGIRWYELRRTTGDWTIRQQGTYAPDGESRWLGSIRLNGSGKIGLGYSVSSSTVYPCIRYCGQSPTAYANATGIMDITEDTIYNSSNYQSSTNRWGDYSMLAVDPTDDETFWFTSQYPGPGGSRRTRIASFQFITGPSVVTLPATNIGIDSATLNGTINPHGEATTCYFKYGIDASALTDSTDAVSAGSDTLDIEVSADILGLTGSQMYYFKLVATNSFGTTSGSILDFTTGALPFMAVLPTNQDVTAPVGSTEFYVSSNVDWTAESDAPWCTVTEAGSGNDTVLATFTENTTMAERIATITIEGALVLPQVVTVTQAPYPVGLTEPLTSVLRIYPNPNTGSFKIVPADKYNGRMDLAVQDLNGTVIFRQVLEGRNEYQVDLPSAAQGLYHVIIRTDQESIVRKLVIIR